MYNVFAFPHEFIKRIETFKFQKSTSFIREQNILFQDTKTKDVSEWRDRFTKPPEYSAHKELVSFIQQVSMWSTCLWGGRLKDFLSLYFLSEENSPSRRDGFYVHGLFLEGCSIWTVVVNQSRDSETRCPPFIFFPYCNVRKPLAICKCGWACSPVGLGRKRTGRIHSCAETSWRNISSCALHPEANDPSQLHQPDPFQVWGFSPSFSDSKTAHTSSICHSPAEGIPAPEDCRDGQSLPSAGTGTWLQPSLSDLVYLIQHWVFKSLGTALP